MIPLQETVANSEKFPNIETYHFQAIPFASKYIFEDGKHNLHLKYKDQFNALVSDFLAQGNVNLMNKCPMWNRIVDFLFPSYYQKKLKRKAGN